MLDRAFMTNFFGQLESLTEPELMQKIEAVEKLERTFTKGSDAYHDARFMLKHLRRELIERLFKTPEGN